MGLIIIIVTILINFLNTMKKTYWAVATGLIFTKQERIELSTLMDKSLVRF